MGQSFCKNIFIFMKCPIDSRKKSDWFCYKKISQKLKYLNFKCEQSEDIFSFYLFVSPLCACPMRKTSLATGEMCEWKSGFSVAFFSFVLFFLACGPAWVLGIWDLGVRPVYFVSSHFL